MNRDIPPSIVASIKHNGMHNLKVKYFVI